MHGYTKERQCCEQYTYGIEKGGGWKNGSILKES